MSYKTGQKGLVGLIILFVVVIIAGVLITLFFFNKNSLVSNIMPKNIGKSYEKLPPDQIRKIHERSFVNPQ